VVLNNGMAEEIGTHQQLLKKNGLYRKLYDMQFQDAS
jgi:ABC-type multidrug transport system fused ATPase/permease subunit